MVTVPTMCAPILPSTVRQLIWLQPSLAKQLRCDLFAASLRSRNGQGASRLVSLLHLLAPLPQILYAFETYPECSLYNGEGGCDDHEGIAATPFRTPPPPPVNYTLVYRQTWPSVATPQEVCTCIAVHFRACLSDTLPRLFLIH